MGHHYNINFTKVCTLRPCNNILCYAGRMAVWCMLLACRLSDTTKDSLEIHNGKWRGRSDKLYRCWQAERWRRTPAKLDSSWRLHYSSSLTSLASGLLASWRFVHCQRRYGDERVQTTRQYAARWPTRSACLYFLQ